MEKNIVLAVCPHCGTRIELLTDTKLKWIKCPQCKEWDMQIEDEIIKTNWEDRLIYAVALPNVVYRKDVHQMISVFSNESFKKIGNGETEIGVYHLDSEQYNGEYSLIMEVDPTSYIKRNFWIIKRTSVDQIKNVFDVADHAYNRTDIRGFVLDINSLSNIF